MKKKVILIMCSTVFIETEVVRLKLYGTMLLASTSTVLLHRARGTHEVEGRVPGLVVAGEGGPGPLDLGPNGKVPTAHCGVKVSATLPEVETAERLYLVGKEGYLTGPPNKRGRAGAKACVPYGAAGGVEALCGRFGVSRAARHG